MKNTPLNEIMRLSLICDSIRYHEPTKEGIRQRIIASNSSDTEFYICTSQIEKDIFKLRNEYDAPIKYCKKIGGYKFTERYNFWKVIFLRMQEKVSLPKQLQDAVLTLDENDN